MEILTITADKNGVRLDVFLCEKLDFTRSKIKNLMDNGCVRRGEIILKPRDLTRIGEEYTIEIADAKESEIKPKDIPIDIVYEDDDLAVINKQQGLTVHAGSGTDDNTLVNALLFRLDKLSGINGVIRPGIVHRIDKDTSGLLVVAKNDSAHNFLAGQLKDKTCNRTYWALLEGVVKEDKGKIDTFIDRSKKNRTMMAVSAEGRQAVTNYKVLKRYNGYTLCEFKLETGRTHQIRVHAKHIGHPIVGDTVYGYKNQKFNLNGQLLHAKKLEFVHPTSKKLVSFEVDLPDYFIGILSKLQKT